MKQVKISIDLLKRILYVMDDSEDSGPMGSGWQSAELKEDCDAVRFILEPVKDKQV